MSVTLRIFLILCSVLSFLLCIKKIKESKLKVENSILWMFSSFLLILMSIFSDFVAWVSVKLGFMAPVNFVFFAIMIFLIIQVFIDNIRISVLNEKIKSLNHYIALKENIDRKDKEK